MKIKRKPLDGRDNDFCQVARCRSPSTTILGHLCSPVGHEIGVCDRHLAQALDDRDEVDRGFELARAKRLGER